jgi:4-hydroxybenzoyl-CoA reductase subunit alpha
VVTGRDTAGVKYAFANCDPDKLPLAIDKVRYIGDDVAALAAVDEDTAEEALGLIDLELEELPAVYDPQEAMRPQAPSLHDHVENNFSSNVVVDLGEVEEGFRQAYLVREDTFTTQAVRHAPLETHVALAQYDPSEGLTVWTSTQTPFNVQEDLAVSLQLPRSKVRVIKPPTGGAFGGKTGMDSPDVCAALLAIKTGRPVRVAYSREEEFLVTPRRHPAIIYLRTAVARDGALLARYCRIILDGGAYNRVGDIPLLLSLMYLNLPYAQKGLHYEGYRVYTNKPPSGPMRGFMSPQVHFAQEVQMALLARDLGLDPVEMRLRNALHIGDVTLSGYQILSSAFDHGLEAVAARARDAGAKGVPRGQGLGCSGFLCGAAFRTRPGQEAFSTTTLVAHPDGFFTLFTGASDVGQGAETTLCQIAAHELGVPIEKVRIVAADTALTPLDMGTYSSRVTMMAGNATLAAAAQVARQLRGTAALKLEANPADLAVAEERIYVRGSPQKGLALSEVIVSCQAAQRGAPVTGQGIFNTEAPGSPTWSFGAQAAEVTVDPETGQAEVSRVVCAHDCGVAINPMAVEGQLEGSVQMGLGFALSEVVAMKGGVTLNPSLLDYKVPTALEMPDIEVVFTEEPDPVGPYGAKEAGEGTVGPTAPAIINAIGEAVGERPRSLPVNPEDLLRAMEAKGPGLTSFPTSPRHGERSR